MRIGRPFEIVTAAAAVLILLGLGGLAINLAAQAPPPVVALRAPSPTRTAEPTAQPIAATPVPTIVATVVLTAIPLPTVIAPPVAYIAHGGNVRWEPGATGIVRGQVCPGDQVEVYSEQWIDGTLWYRMILRVQAANCDSNHLPIGVAGWVSSSLVSTPTYPVADYAARMAQIPPPPIVRPTWVVAAPTAFVGSGGSGGSSGSSGGLTTCADGTVSASHGRGTCSHHGGIK